LSFLPFHSGNSKAGGWAWEGWEAIDPKGEEEEEEGLRPHMLGPAPGLFPPVLASWSRFCNSRSLRLARSRSRSMDREGLRLLEPEDMNPVLPPLEEEALKKEALNEAKGRGGEGPWGDGVEAPLLLSCGVALGSSGVVME
jgi:hypothetical protein